MEEIMIGQDSKQITGTGVTSLGDSTPRLIPVLVAYSTDHWLKLPPEIWLETFLFVTGTGSRPSSSPLLLGSICRQWRQLSVSYANLWDSVSLSVSRKNHSDQVQLLTEWLARAQGRPISVNLAALQDRETIEYFEEYAPRSIPRILRTHSQHIRKLSVFLPLGWQHELDALHLPILEELVIVPTYPVHATRSHTIWFSCPLLRKFSAQDFDVARIKIHWYSLVELQYEGLFISECHSLLKQAPQLVHCQFRQVFAESGGTPLAGLGQLDECPHLESFSITHTEAKFVASVFTILPTLPLVRHLEIDARVVTPNTLLHLLLPPFLRSVSTTLRTLMLTNAFQSESEVIATLRHLPLLSELKIGGQPPLTETLFVFLDQEASSFLPSLQSLQCTGRVTFYGHVLEKLLQLRWRCENLPPECRQLSQMAINATSSVKFSDEARFSLQAMIKEGLDLRITVEGQAFL